LIRIDRMHHSRLLRDDQRSPARTQTDQYRRLSKVEVGATGLRTIRPLRRGAAVVEGVILRQLLRPQQLAGLQIHGKDRVAGVRGRVRIVVAGRNVKNPELLVDRRR